MKQSAMLGVAAFGAALLLGMAPRTGEPRPLRPGDPALQSVAWLAGSWACDYRGALIEEHWTAPSGGTLMGMSRTVRDGKTREWEFLRIEKQVDAIVYLASPSGRSPATPFKLTSSANDTLVFENPEHDFPKKISYAKDGANVRVVVAGDEAGKPRKLEWTLEPARIMTE